MHPCKVPAAWRDYGARFGTDGLLYLAEWRRGFTVHDLRVMFWQCQQVRSLQADLRAAKIDVERAREAQDEAERRAEWYRRQCGLQARVSLLSELFGGE